MNHKEIKERCKNVKFICRVYLEGYDFVYDGSSNFGKGAGANIILKQGSRKGEGLFEISEIYSNIIIQEAKDCNLPENYIKEKL